MPRLIDYLESAEADNTGTSRMDRLLAENEISNMHTEGSLWADEPYDPARSIAEGDFTPMGLIGKAGKMKWASVMDDELRRLRNFRKWIKEGASTPLDPQTLDEFGRVIEHSAKTRILKGGRQGFEKGKQYSEKYKGTDVPSNVGRSRKFGSRKWNPPVPEEQLIDPKIKFQLGGLAVQDETAHTNMDRLIAEYGQSQEPQYSVREYQEPYDPVRAIAEGDFMPVGAGLRIMKGSPYWSTVKNLMGKSSNRYKKKWEVYEDAARKFGKEVDRGGSDKAAEQYLTSKWIERVLE